jgi:hypothetical protein
MASMAVTWTVEISDVTPTITCGECGHRSFGDSANDAFVNAWEHMAQKHGEVWIVGANDAQSETKIRGMTLAGVYGDEASLAPEAGTVPGNSSIERTFRYKD